MKGFTLIELLAVIVILSIILLISVPIINGIIEGTKKSAFESSAKGYMASARNLYVTNSLKGIAEDTVINYLDGVPSNTKLEMAGGSPKSGTIIIYKTGSIEFSLYDGVYCAIKNISSNDITVTKKDEAECVIELPVLTLVGEAIVDIEPNTTYVDQGVSYSTGIIETTIRKDGTIVDTIDTSSFGIYEITYKLTVEEKFNTITRTVRILDNEAPVLIVPSDISITVAEVASFNALTGVSVTDNSGETIIPTVSGNISELAGIYILTYTATDSSNNTTTITRNITVLQPPLINTSSMTAAEISAMFTPNPNTARGTVSYVNGGVISTTSHAWDGAFFALNGTFPRSGELTVEYEISHNVAPYTSASTGGALLLANASTYNPASVTGYYNHPTGPGVHFQTFSTSAPFRWNVAARIDSLSYTSFNETYAPTSVPSFTANTYFSIKSYINLDTGYFEHRCNDIVVRTGTISAAGMNQMGSNFKIVFMNGNYTSQTTNYRNIKIELK